LIKAAKIYFIITGEKLSFLVYTSISLIIVAEGKILLPNGVKQTVW